MRNKSQGHDSGSRYSNALFRPNFRLVGPIAAVLLGVFALRAGPSDAAPPTVSYTKRTCGAGEASDNPTSNNTWIDVASKANNGDCKATGTPPGYSVLSPVPSGTADVFVTASFVMSSTDGNAAGSWRLVLMNGTTEVQHSQEVHATTPWQNTQGSQYTLSIAWIFTNVSPTHFIKLQHRADGAGASVRLFVTQDMQIAALAMSTSGYSLSHQISSMTLPSVGSSYTQVLSLGASPVDLQQSSGGPVIQVPVTVPATANIQRHIVFAFTASTYFDNPVAGRWADTHFRVKYSTDGGISFPNYASQVYRRTTDLPSAGFPQGAGLRLKGPVVIFGKIDVSVPGTYQFRVEASVPACPTFPAGTFTCASTVGVQDATLAAFTTAHSTGYFRVLKATSDGLADVTPPANGVRTYVAVKSNAVIRAEDACQAFAGFTHSGGTYNCDLRSPDLRDLGPHLMFLSASGYTLKTSGQATGSTADALWEVNVNNQPEFEGGGQGVSTNNKISTFAYSYNGSVPRWCMTPDPNSPTNDKFWWDQGAVSSPIPYSFGCDVGNYSGLGFTPTLSPATTTPTWRLSEDLGINGASLVTTPDIILMSMSGYTPNWAAVNEVRGASVGGKSVVSWNTSAEMGTASFRLERHDGEKEWVTVGPAVIPALPPSLAGATYTVDDPGAAPGGKYVYRIVEQETKRGEMTYGPFTVTIQPDGNATGHEKLDRGTGYSRTVTPPSNAPVKRPPIGAANLPWATNAWKAWVQDEGVYAVRVDAGGTPQLAKDHRITNRGQAVRFANDSRNQRLLFFGSSLKSLHSSRNAYLMKPGTPSNMQEITGNGPTPTAQPASFQQKVKFEQDAFMAPAWVFDAEQDFWFWKIFMAERAGYQTAEIPVELPLADTAGGQASLQIGIQGIWDTTAASDYHLRLSLNGTQIGELSLDGSGPLGGTVTFDASLIQPSSNTLKIDALLDPGLGRSWWYLNGFEITYPRRFETDRNEVRVTPPAGQSIVTVDGFTTPDIMVFDVSAPLSPVWIKALTVQSTGAKKSPRYSATFARSAGGTDYYLVGADRLRTASLTPLVDAGLRTRTAGAEHVVVAPYDLLEQAGQLSKHRDGQGLSSTAVPLEAIWDEYGEGLPSPDALKAFLADAAARWSRSPRYVVLAGRGSTDERNILGYADCLVPTTMAGTSRGLVGTDWPYVAGTNAVIGRIPVTTAAELQGFVDKIKSHEGASRSNNVTLAADDSDDGGNFSVSSEAVASVIPLRFALNRAYLPDVPVESVRSSLRDAFGRGDAVVSWVGHAAPDRLAAEGVFSTTDVATLPASTRLSLFTAASCIVNTFHFVGTSSLGEQLVARAGGGAVASFAPVATAYDDVSVAIIEKFLESATSSDKRLSRLGDAVRTARESVSPQVANQEALSFFAFLGDPASYVP